MQLPLTALRAFEAVVRHRSIKKAAEELNVTAAAVSYQLKYLEEYLGVALFRRAPRGIVPNRASSAVQPLLADAFERLHDAVVRLKSTSGRSHLTVTTTTYRSEEHTSELQSLMRISYAVFCLKTKT